MKRSRYALNAIAAVLVASFVAVEPAHASGEIICEAVDGSDASIDVGIGHLPVLHVLSARATDGSKTWSTRASDDDIPIVFGQGFADDSQVLIDFTDPNVERIIVSLRLFQVSGEESYAEAGVLSFEGRSAFAVRCDNG